MIIKETINGITIEVNDPKNHIKLTTNAVNPQVINIHVNTWDEMKKTIEEMLGLIKELKI